MNNKKTNSSKNYTSNTTFSFIQQTFIFYKKAEGISPRTLKDYNYTFKTLSKYYNEDYINIEKLHLALLEMFSFLSEKKSTTYNLPLSYLNCFFNWAKENNYILENPITTLGFHRRKDFGKIRNIPTDIISKLFSIIDVNTYTGIRDYSLLALTLDTGIRPNEACNLLINDLDLEHHCIKIRKEIAKTRVERILPISYQTTKILQKFLSLRDNNWKDFLFLSINGLQFSTDTWEKRIKLYSKLVNYKFTPYDLRHTFAILYLKNGGNVFSLQKMLGHTDLTMTKRYVNFTQTDIQEQHITVSPINNFIKRTSKIKRNLKNFERSN